MSDTYKRPEWISEDGRIDAGYIDSIADDLAAAITKPVEQMAEVIEVLLEEVKLSRVKGIREGFDLSITCAEFGAADETVEALRKYADLQMIEVRRALGMEETE